MDRVTGHLDLDYFFAQVEEVQDPSLKKRPVLVCVFSGRTDESGVVSTTNYVARGLGIKSGMPISLAKKKLVGSNAALIRMDHAKYEAISERIMQTTRRSVDVFEQSGIDEAYFDVTKTTQGDYDRAKSIVLDLKRSIARSEGLTSSVGVGLNKVVAKIASDFSKPDGLTIVKPEATRSFLDPLAVDKLYGVGPKTADTLKQIKVKTIGDLASQSVESLEKIFGRKFGIYLHDAANGINGDPVVEDRGSTQLSRIITLKRNTKQVDEVFEQLSPAIRDVHSRLIEGGQSFRTISVIGILTDLSTKTRSRTLEGSKNDLPTLQSYAKLLLEELTASTGRELRRAGVRVAGLASTADQTSLSEYVKE